MSEENKEMLMGYTFIILSLIGISYMLRDILVYLTRS